MIIIRNFLFIQRQIQTSRNQMHLATCEDMIEKRIDCWGPNEFSTALRETLEHRKQEILIAEAQIEAVAKIAYSEEEDQA